MGRSSGGSRRKLKLSSPYDEGSWNLGERANKCRRVRDLKFRKIWAMVDGQGVGVMSREGEKGCVIPYRDVSVGGVKIPIDVVLVSREGGKDKNCWTGERRPRRGGGGAAATGVGGWKNAGGGRRFSKGSIIFRRRIYGRSQRKRSRW